MGKRKKKRTHVRMEEGGDPSAPRSFVFRRGAVAASLVGLTEDMRKVMQPYTAGKLRESKKNSIRDFLNVAPVLKVSHFLIFSQPELGPTMRVIRIPRGPTLTFRVMEYSLMKDVVKIQKRPHSHGSEFEHPPLVVLNNFSGNDDHKKIMTVMLQNMFPPVNVHKVKLADCRRVLLFSLNTEDQTIDMRHYVINASPVGLTKSVKKIIKAKLPDLNKYEDISDFVERNNDNFSDSEVEDTPDSRVTLPQNFTGRGNRASHKSAIRLKELGPRLKLQLIKIEEEFCTGRVIFHSFIKRTPEEARQLQIAKQEKEALKKARREEQEANVARKKALEEEKKAKRKAKSQNGGSSMQEVEAEDDDEDQDGEDKEAEDGEEHEDVLDLDEDEDVEAAAAAPSGRGASGAKDRFHNDLQSEPMQDDEDDEQLQISRDDDDDDEEEANGDGEQKRQDDSEEEQEQEPVSKGKQKKGKQPKDKRERVQPAVKRRRTGRK